jgi:hypothetical protein
VRIRNVLQEYEAKLTVSKPGSAITPDSAQGKGEWKVYGDGTQRCKVRVSGLSLPEGVVLHVLVNGQPIGEMMVERGAARYKRESERGEYVPAVDANQVLQVSYNGQAILEGRFYSE